MKNRTFKFIPYKYIKGSAIIALVYETDIQSFAKSNFGRELSESELRQVSETFWDDERVTMNTHSAIHAAIEVVLNDDESDHATSLS